MRVKGVAIVDLVKAIRSQKERDWSRYLEPADYDVLKSIVLASSYYPGETFWRLFQAVTQELGKGSLETAFLFGRNSGRTYLEVYQRLVVPGDPGATVESFVKLWENFYDFQGAPYEPMEVESAPLQVRVIAHDYPDMTIPEAREPYFHGLAGYFQEIAEQASGKRIQHTITDHGSSFELTYRWI